MSVVDLSPDGRRLAYTVSDPKRKRFARDPHPKVYGPTGVPVFFDGCEVWVTDVVTKESINVGRRMGTSCSPVWSPDGKRLAFFSDRAGAMQAWVWDAQTGALKSLCSAIVRPYAVCGPSWTPDGARLLVKVLPEAMTLDEAARLGVMPAASRRSEQDIERGSSVIVYKSSAPKSSNTAAEDLSDSFTDVFLGDLAFIDVVTGKMDRIVRGDRCHWFSISPNGVFVAYTRPRGYASRERGLQYYYDLVVVETRTGRSRVVAPMAQGTSYPVSWSPNSMLLAFTTSGDQTRGDCYVVPADGSEPPRRITSGSHPGFSREFRAPLWNPDGRSVYLLSSGAQTGLWRISVEEGIAREITRIPDRAMREIVSAGVNSNTYWSPDGGRSMVVVTRHERTMDSGFYKIDLKSGAHARLVEEPKTYGGGIGG
jgi:Tol biopolymer transport system component